MVAKIYLKKSYNLLLTPNKMQQTYGQFNNENHAKMLIWKQLAMVTFRCGYFKVKGDPFSSRDCEIILLII